MLHPKRAIGGEEYSVVSSNRAPSGGPEANTRLRRPLEELEDGVVVDGRGRSRVGDAFRRVSRTPLRWNSGNGECRGLNIATIVDRI